MTQKIQSNDKKWSPYLPTHDNIRWDIPRYANFIQTPVWKFVTSITYQKWTLNHFVKVQHRVTLKFCLVLNLSSLKPPNVIEK